jgi:copper chaperone NosL
MKKLSPTSRIILALAAISLIGSYFLPLWRIDLWAPQYPEGLSLYIWHNRLAGDVAIINGLNHYIGMAHLNQESFPEFKIMPFLVGGFALLGLLVAFIGQQRWLKVQLAILVTTGIAALADFYRWGYEYGHNLDPNAAIKVPGMAYQPPVLGYKELLNFGAYSIPDLGGWIFIVASGIAALVCVYECFYLNSKFAVKKTKEMSKNFAASTIILLGLVWSMSCNAGPEPIIYGKEACASCKMNIVDNKFSCEIVTNKGKAFKFDDILCLVRYMKAEKMAESDLKHMVVSDYLNGGQFLEIKKAWFLTGTAFKSPMNGNMAAVKSESEAKSVRLTNIQPITWMEIYNQF